MHYFFENAVHYFYKNVGGGVVFICSMNMNVKYEVYINCFLGDYTKISSDFIRLAKDQRNRETLLRHKVEAEDDKDIVKKVLSYKEAYEECKLLDNIYDIKDFTLKLVEEYSFSKKVNEETTVLKEKLNGMTREEVLKYKLDNYRSPLCHESFDLPKDKLINQIILIESTFKNFFRE